MKLWTLVTSLSLSLLLLSGCGGSPKPQQGENIVVDSTLPVVVLTKNGTKVDMKSVAFEWHLITDRRVKGIYVYKKSPSKEKVSKLEYYKTIPNRYTTHYADNAVESDTRYSYVFKTFSESAESTKSQTIIVNTLPILSSVSWIHSITGLPRTAKILWRPHSNERVASYVIERKTLEDAKWEEIATIDGRLNVEYIDEDLNDNYVYMYRVRVLTFDDILSTPSQIVKVVTKPLPKSVTGLKASNDLANRIALKWNKTTDKDFAFYYLYRSSKINGKYELIATLHNNKFVDKIEENGQMYFYRVSVVDKDGLESEYTQNSIQGVTLIQPSAPAIVEAKLVGNNIVLKWSKTDFRSRSFIVYKTHKKGWFNETSEEFTDIKENQFIDRDVEHDSVYTYTVYSVDENSIKSDASVAVKVLIPESTVIEAAPKVNNRVKKVVSTPIVEKKEDVVQASDDLDLSGL